MRRMVRLSPASLGVTRRKCQPCFRLPISSIGLGLGHERGTAISGEKSYSLNNVTVHGSKYGIAAGGDHVIATCNNVEVKNCTGCVSLR